MGCCKSHDQDRKLDKLTTQTGNTCQSPLNNNNDSQQLLINNNENYLSTADAPNTCTQIVIDDDDDKKQNDPKCQTPPIIKTLFGATELISDDYDDDDGQNRDVNKRETPMAGNVYLGFANNEQLLFQHLNQSPMLGSCSNSNPSNQSHVSNSNTYTNHSNSSSQSNATNDWIPSKQNNAALLMGFAARNEAIAFNTEPVVSPKYINFDNGQSLNLDAMPFPNDNSPFTASNMSLNSVHLADLVIASKANNSPQVSLKNASDFAMLSRWMIATFNVFVEYLPYKHIMEEIFLFCNIDINDAVFVHCDLNFSFPDTSALQSKFNYYDVPDLYIENVSVVDKKQPSFVLMIGAPGSGKSSYAEYRYGKHAVVAADDYFDINYNGQFIGSLLSAAHEYCLEQCLIRLYKKETVVVANTHASFWQMYDKIIPLLFDGVLTHKIVFAVMPEVNATTLVRRCMHSCTKPKIIEYLQGIQYMQSIGINSDNVLIYGHNEEYKVDVNRSNQHLFGYGLWIEPESFYNLQEWFQHYTNCNLLQNGDFGDGRISPIRQETWQIFKKNMKTFNRNLSKFNASTDPFIDLELKIIGFSNHTLCQMVTVEIIKECINDIADNENKYFWDMFENGVDINMMGCVLTMRHNIPFSNAKLLFNYNCIQYINDGPIIKAKLATKRYIKNYTKYCKPPLALNNKDNKIKKNKNIFFSLDGISTSNDLFRDKKNKQMDIKSFSLQLLEKNLNPNATEFKMEENSAQFLDVQQMPIQTINNKNNTLNPTANEFKPSTYTFSKFHSMKSTGFAASVLRANNNFNQCQQIANYPQMNTLQMPQLIESWDIPIKNTNNNNNNNGQYVQTMQNDLKQECESWDIPITENNNPKNEGTLDATAPSFTPSTNGYNTIINNAVRNDNNRNDQQSKNHAYW